MCWRKVKWFRIILCIVVVYFGWRFVGQQQQLNRIHAEMEASSSRLSDVTQENDAMQQERERLLTPEYVEKLAREEMGLVKPGEVPYLSGTKNQ